MFMLHIHTHDLYNSCIALESTDCVTTDMPHSVSYVHVMIVEDSGNEITDCYNKLYVRFLHDSTLFLVDAKHGRNY